MSARAVACHTAAAFAAVCLILAAGAAPARADAVYDRCIDESDGTNTAWAACGSDYVARADKALNATWKRVYGATEGQTKTDLLAAQRAWVAFKEKACAFYVNGDWGREGEVLSYPACVAAIIEARTADLETYGDVFKGE
jgi:uncharacterized protein YecT (DUF1311 family)